MKNKKRYILFIFNSLLFLFGNAQKCVYEDNLQLSLNATGISHPYLFRSFGNSQLLLTEELTIPNQKGIQVKDKLSLVKATLSNKKQQVFTLFFKKEFPAQTITDLLLTRGEDSLFLLSNKTLFLLIPGKESTFKEHTSIELKYNFKNIHFLSNDTIFLSTCYNYNPKEQPENTIITAYPLNGKNPKFIRPVFEGIQFSHFSHKWFANSEDEIIFSQTTDYKISFYNRNLECTDSITRDFKGDWKKYKPSGKTTLETMGNLQLFHEEDAKISRIQKIYLNESGYLFVFYKLQGDFDQLLMDIWKKDTKWKLYKTAVPIGFVKGHSCYQFKNTGPVYFNGFDLIIVDTSTRNDAGERKLGIGRIQYGF